MSPCWRSRITKWSSAIRSWGCGSSRTKTSRGNGALSEWCCSGDRSGSTRENFGSVLIWWRRCCRTHHLNQDLPEFLFHPGRFAYPAGMSLLPFETLPAYKPRQFLPAQIDLGEWTHLAPFFDELENRAARCATAADLERWLVDWSELGAALDEEAGRRYIAMTCHTDNAEAEKAYLHFVESVEPQIKT